MPERPLEQPQDVRATRRWQAGGTAMLFLLVLAFPLYRATEGSRLSQALATQDRALITGGAKLYQLNCATCHGRQGQGVDAPALNAQEFLTGATDAQIHGIVAGGVPGTEMPAWLNEYGGGLTHQEIAEIVAYLRSLEPTAPSRPDWRTPGKP